MKSLMTLLVVAACLAIGAARGEPSAYKSELEQNIESVQSYLQGPEQRLTRLLRGFTGIEVNIYFRTNSSEIDRINRERIYNVAKTMLVYPMLNISLGGHTDNRGSNSYNKTLSQRRIDAVMKVFRDALGRNYDAKRFYSNAYGKQIAAYRPDDKEGMFYDRRVSILLLVQSKHPY
jgi:outer membrane protein OmpA-like peptidoglycan-associated protein